MALARIIRLLDAWPDLGRDLSEAELAVARREIVLPALDVEPGTVEVSRLAAAAEVRGAVVGAVVIDGLLTGELRLDGRRARSLHGPGDLLVLDGLAGTLLGADSSITALRRSTIVLLDDSFLAVQRSWPAVAERVLVEAGRRSPRGEPHDGGAQSVEERLLAVLSSAAERWGRAVADGVAIDLPLTCELLARVVGGRSATVALALRTLSDRDLVRRADDSWVLRQAGIVEGVDDIAGTFGDAPPAEGLLMEALDGAIAFLGADYGDVQIYDAEDELLRITVQRGFDDEFLDYFAEVRMGDGSTCGRTTTGHQIVIPDVNADEPMAPHREIAEASGWRAVQSTPLIDSTGRLRGVLSTHFRNVHRPRRGSLRVVSAQARVLADGLAQLSRAT